MLNKCYQENNKKLQKEARERCQIISEEKNKIGQRASERHQNLSEEEKK